MGSEMCIRDRLHPELRARVLTTSAPEARGAAPRSPEFTASQRLRDGAPRCPSSAVHTSEAAARVRLAGLIIIFIFCCFSHLLICFGVAQIYYGLCKCAVLFLLGIIAFACLLGGNLIISLNTVSPSGTLLVQDLTCPRLPHWALNSRGAALPCSGLEPRPWEDGWPGTHLLRAPGPERRRARKRQAPC